MSLRYFPIAIVCSLLVTACGSGSSSSSSRAEPSRPLNDTGITLCGNYADDGGSGNHKNDLVCVAVGATRTVAGTDADNDPVPAGQDAVFGRDAQALTGTLAKTGAGHAGFDFTKLDSNGDELPASATEWDCVRDNHTGLIWEIKTDGGLRDKDHTYSWYNSDASSNGGDAGNAHSGSCSGGTGCDTEKYVADVNAIRLCGYSDWRMPTRNELLNIVHNDRVYPALDLDYFPDTQSSNYWSSSTHAENNSYAWVIQFGSSDVTILPKTGNRRVRLVYGNASDSQSNNVSCANENSSINATTPTADFTDHGDGTVTHDTTGLMWMQCSLGQSGADCATGSADYHNWLQAHEAAQDANDGEGTLGYNDWRLPNKNELASIVEERCWDSATNGDIFPSTPPAWFWSSSPHASGGDRAWPVDFSDGDLSSSILKGSVFRVRLVRDAY